MVTTTSAADGRDPSHALTELASPLVDGQPFEQTLRRIAELAKQTLDGVEDVSLTIIEDGRP